MCGVVCGDNSKSVMVVLVYQVVRGSVDNLGCGCGVGCGCGSWEMRERPHELYPNRNRWLYDTILTDKHSLIIHKTVYSILIILIIYQDKKIG